MAVAALTSERKDNVWDPFPNDFINRNGKDWNMLVRNLCVVY